MSTNGKSKPLGPTLEIEDHPAESMGSAKGLPYQWIQRYFDGFLHFNFEGLPF